MKTVPKFRYAMKCISCGREMPHDRNYYTCICGSLLLPERDEEYIRRTIGQGQAARNYFDSIRYGNINKKYPYGSGVFMWIDYLLPGFPKKAVASLREGFTDLFEPPKWLKEKIGLKNLYVKMEGQNPSGSFKDRGMPVAVSEARRLQIYHPDLGIKSVACASTGDTSASATVYAAYYRDKLGCIVFLTYNKMSREQLAQAIMSGALVVAIKHPHGFDACMRLIKEYSAKHKEIVLVNSANAFRLVGQETIALEIFQDLRWKAPNWISIPAGNGGNLTALLISCLRARDLGLIDRLPGIIVAQTKGANTLVRWARSGFKDYKPGIFKDSIASAMNIQDPVSFLRIKKLMKEFHILFYDVEENEIQHTRALFNNAAVDVCPQGAVALNAVLQARQYGRIKEMDTVVSISTASGLKFVESALGYHEQKYKFSNHCLVENTGTIEGIERLLSN